MSTAMFFSPVVFHTYRIITALTLQARRLLNVGDALKIFGPRHLASDVTQFAREKKQGSKGLDAIFKARTEIWVGIARRSNFSKFSSRDVDRFRKYEGARALYGAKLKASTSLEIYRST